MTGVYLEDDTLTLALLVVPVVLAALFIWWWPL